MTTLGRVGVSVPTPTTTQARETPLDPGALRLRKLEQKSDADTLRDKVLVSGTSDATRPPGSPKTDGISFAAGQAIEIAHGLGRAARGFIVVDCQVSAHALINDKANLSKGLENTHIRLKHTGGSSCIVKVQVL